MYSAHYSDAQNGIRRPEVFKGEPYYSKKEV
jgi:hypothetical protein